MVPELPKAITLGRAKGGGWTQNKKVTERRAKGGSWTRTRRPRRDFRRQRLATTRRGTVVVGALKVLASQRKQRCIGGFKNRPGPDQV
ncbi:hypothetical protein PIB30_077131 [Stylosanthes scabra]|uniref:Uncharacterized protein n=1 Tax=Stylosanthes scabra TaxID=79078 RepID=A0ABU6TR72_9FABA|nr:hypothetical protein [Stylosanthes scabra]